MAAGGYKTHSPKIVGFAPYCLLSTYAHQFNPQEGHYGHFCK